MKARGPLARGVGLPLLDDVAGVIHPVVDRERAIIRYVEEAGRHQRVDECGRVVGPLCGFG